MKNWLRIILVVEIQAVLILLILMSVRMIRLENRVYITNKILYQTFADRKTTSLNAVRDDDIIIGTPDAPVTLFLYSRFDCSVCNDFFARDYQKLKSDFIDAGKTRLVIRYLVHSSKPFALYAVKSAYYAYESGSYDTYVKQMASRYPLLDTTSIKNLIVNLDKHPEAFLNSISDKNKEEAILQLASKARDAGIRSTPTFFINQQPITGYPGYEKLRKLILTELAND